MSLTKKLLMLFLILSLVPIVLMGTITYYSNQSLLEEKTIQYLQAVNIQKKAQINQWITNGKKHIEFIATLSDLRVKLHDNLEKIQLQTQKKSDLNLLAWLHDHFTPLIEQETFQEIFLLCKDSGIVLYSTAEAEIGKNKHHKAYFSQVKHQTTIENIYYSLSIRQPTLTIGTPIMNGNNELVAIIVGRLNLTTLTEIMHRRSDYSSSEDSYLVNGLGFYVTEPRYANGYALRKSIHTQGGKAIQLHETGISSYTDYRGVEVVGAYEWVDEWKMGLITEIDRVEYLTPIMEMRQATLFIGALTAFMATYFGLRSGHSIIRPIQDLVNDIKTVKAEDLDYKAPKELDGDIGLLAQTFEMLTVRLKNTLVSKKLLEKEVTIRKNTEKKLSDTVTELHRSNKELEQFAYVASHDLQEPLRMITSFTQLLGERYSSVIDENGQKYIYFATDGASRMQKLIEDLLTYSRVTTRGKQFTAVDCNELFRLITMNLATAIEKKGAIITSDTLPVLDGDESQLLQLFQNLVSNGIKFCPEKTPHVHITSKKQSNYWLFSVSDNGIGIESKYQAKVFAIFQRLHTREEYSGTGIGLAVCKRIVERHGGKLWFESEPGVGTSFFFTLPTGHKVTGEHQLLEEHNG